MKKIIYGLLTLVTFSFAVSSCDNATDTTKGYIENIFTLKGNTLIPELSDTSYIISNIKDFALKDGDRAIMRIKYYYDTFFGMSNAVWQLDEVISTIPLRKILSADDINPDDMNSSFSGIYPYFGYDPVWIWDKKQNISVLYHTDDTAPEFAMTATGVTADTINLSLWAKTISGDKLCLDLLTFDLSDIPSLLNETDRTRIMSADTLYTKITMSYLGSDSDTPETMNIIGGKCANPYK